MSTTQNSTLNSGANVHVHYVDAARRHMKDARVLLENQRVANAGQLYGFVAECGLKALLIACGVQPDANGEIPKGNKFRQHVPVLSDKIIANGNLIPNNSRSSKYLTSLSNISNLNNWSIDHRYWKDSALPLNSLTAWQVASEEILQMLDKAKEDGVLI